jgi:hypothetical protein
MNYDHYIKHIATIKTPVHPVRFITYNDYISYSRNVWNTGRLRRQCSRGY